MPSIKLTKKNIDALEPASDGQVLYWDLETAGFGLLVSGRTKTFVLRKGNRRRKIGRYGPWTPEEARKEACRRIVEMDLGRDPYFVPKEEADEKQTLGAAIEAYIAALQSRGGSEVTIHNFQKMVRLYLEDWKSRRLTNISKADCRLRHREITQQHGPSSANLAMRYLRVVYSHAAKVSEAPLANPTKAVDWNREERRQEPIPWAQIPAWKATVDKLSPVLRDYLYVTLFTGLRSKDAATIRWDDIDFVKGDLHRPCPKGGKDRAFTIPLSKYVLEILRRRRAENAGKDGGYAFPTQSKPLKVSGRAAGQAVPLSYRRWGPGKSRGPHRLRDTYTTACHEAGLSPYDIDVLTNHRPPKGSVTAGYIRQDSDYLRGCQEQVTEYLLKKLQK